MNLSQSQNTDFKYRATFLDEIGEIYLYRTNGYLYGNVHLDSLSYQIEPINDRYAVLLRRDYSNDRCEIEIKDEVFNRLDSGLSRSKTLFSTSTVIDVMVLFSNQA
ncbi:MAG: hypothetical protein MI700_01425, partial [Balneolales bacterium]|nr:hypothetical protein [Balneolales bacterium]